ncbi:CRT domain-containing protein [Trichostrongylus colubriformis]|uniref:CRT domain-containing protein n=1 Tax=Trichostrongylus colubriformis TaxID=6319 RepID=A0AAN8F9U9_TRICO
MKPPYSIPSISVNPEDEPRINRFNPFVFLPATVCDIIATSMSYVGLTLTSASSYQMLRGALIVCTGLLSILILRARIKGYQWLGMILCVLGLIVIGITDIYFSGDKPGEKSNVVVGKCSGDFLCIISQVVVSIQLVIEQKYMRQYNVAPLLVVGTEGKHVLLF